MTLAGRLIVIVEQLLFIFAAYVIGYDIFYGWWNFHPVKISAVVQVGVFALLFIICQLCFLRAAITDPGWIFPGSTSVQDGSESSFVERKANGKVRICAKCKAIKPDRAHHCSICNRCVLKMDHHCPFVNNCIGFFNYKYFFNFLFWIVVFCIYVIVLVVLDGLSNNEIRIVGIVVGFLCTVVLFLVSILFCNHLRFVSRNVTTIEHVEKRKSTTFNQYDLGAFGNITQVFGNNPLLWLFPFWTSVGNGYVYELRPNKLETSLLLARSS